VLSDHSTELSTDTFIWHLKMIYNQYISHFSYIYSVYTLTCVELQIDIFSFFVARHGGFTRTANAAVACQSSILARDHNFSFLFLCNVLSLGLLEPRFVPWEHHVVSFLVKAAYSIRLALCLAHPALPLKEWNTKESEFRMRERRDLLCDRAVILGLCDSVNCEHITIERGGDDGAYRVQG
jgi:hypothetical protein